MSEKIARGRLHVAAELDAFVREEALPGSGVDEDAFWSGFEAILDDFVPRNRALLARRDELQRRLDEWHQAHPGPVSDQAAYLTFLREIGYLVEEPDDVAITTQGVDDEVALQAGPQLVVPMLNARFAANAANARWGSLYDALYGTDVIAEDDGREKGTSYNPVRGAEVVARARAFLDEHLPLASGSHTDATRYAIADGALVVALADGSSSGLADPGQYVGHRGDPDSPEAVLLVHHGHAHLSVSPPSGPATFTYRHRPSTSACKQHRLRRCTAARLFSCHPSFSSLIQPSAGVPPRMPLAGVPPCVLHPSPSISIPLILPI